MPVTETHFLLEDVDDPVLARRAGDGDVRAFATLVRRHEPVVRVYARRILGSSTDVDDVAQETFHRVAAVAGPSRNVSDPRLASPSRRGRP